MRKLLLFFTFVLTAVGVKAYELDLTKTWPVDGANEKVAKISLANAGELTAALDDLNSQMTDYSHLYISNGAGFDLTPEDIAALSTVTCPTLDIQNLRGSDGGHHGPFTFANASIKRVILPDYWDKAAVKAAAETIIAGNTGFEAALSQHGEQNQATADAKLVAYLNKPNTLYTAMRHTYFDGRADKKMGNATPSYCSFEKLGYVCIMGNASARDISSEGDFDANGHFIPNEPADETNISINNGGTRKSNPTGTDQAGALKGASLLSLDLENAIFSPQNDFADLTLSWTNVLGERTEEIIFPTDPSQTTIPADCLSAGGLGHLEEICIPSNIKYLRTRAFWSASQCLSHVWTTGTDEHTVYDNGCYTMTGSGDEVTSQFSHEGHAPLDDPYWGNGNLNNPPYRYGTITLSANIEVIESYCFSCQKVKDLYMLGTTAPECHVDAFSMFMYTGNNTINAHIEGGMITRESYCNNYDTGTFVTMLHYPRETGTPNTQRYTDPSREYKVATTLRDGQGNIIYFPNQSEVNRAFMQGTTGYLWKAWDPERVIGGGNDNAFVNNPIITATGTTKAHTTAVQEDANLRWESNPEPDDTYTSRAFYDVRLDSDGEPTLTKPTGLEWYYNQYRGGQQLYPQPETVGIVDEHGDPVMETVPVYDANGNIIYDPAAAGATYEGNYIRNEVDVYVKAANGEYYHPLLARNNDGTKPKPWYSQTQKQVADPDGDYIWTQTIGDQYNYTECSNWLTWGHTEAELAEKRATGWTFSMQDVWVKDENNGTHYISDEYVTYSEDASDYVEGVNATRYNKVVDYVFTEATSSDAGPFWTMRTEIAQAQEVTKKRDYRGWHQFVLAAATNMSDIPEVPIRFYQTDNDWWTICMPFDLTRSEMVKFFGNETTGDLPYLSKLLYVVRDYDKKRITLEFSHNLMEYKEAVDRSDPNNLKVHGYIDETTKYTDEEIAADPIVLYAGVPYLIRPHLADGAARRFYITQLEYPELYQKLYDSQYLDGGTLETMIYKGEYEVPAYVIDSSNSKEETTDSKIITTLGAGSGYTHEYTSGTIAYQNSTANAKISTEFTYTFVGSFFLSRMPKNCYFLGWDSNNNCAGFWYNAVPDFSEFTWNNQTGIIVPNFPSNTQIDPATGVADPAKWDFYNDNWLTGDDLNGVTFERSNMAFNAHMPGLPTGIEEVTTQQMTIKADRNTIYNINGQVVRTDGNLQGLSKGVYLVNGKKYVVK